MLSKPRVPAPSDSWPEGYAASFLGVSEDFERAPQVDADQPAPVDVDNDALSETFGLWEGGEDGLVVQEGLRAEWERD